MKIRFLTTFFFALLNVLCFGQSSLSDSLFKNSTCDKLVKSSENFNREISSSYITFVDSLKVAVLNRDSNFIESHLSVDIKSIYDISGKKNFIAFWDIKDQESTFWKLMEKILLFDSIKTTKNSVLIPDISLYNQKCFDKLKPFLVLCQLEMITMNSKQIIQIPKDAIVHVDQMEEPNFNLLAKELSGKTDFVELCNNCKLLVTYENKKGYVNSDSLWPLAESLAIFFEYKNEVWEVNSIQIF